MLKRSLFFLLAMTAASPVLAQPAPGGPDDGPPDFAQMRLRMADRMKEALDVDDAQFKTLGPKIEKVQRLKRDLLAGRMGMMMGFGPGPGGPPPGFGPGGPGGRGGPDGPGFGPGGPDGPDRPGAEPPPPRRGGGPATRPSRVQSDRGPARGQRGGGPPPGGPGGFGPGPDGRHSEVRDRLEDLQDLLDDKDAKPADIKAKIEALHQARAKAQTELAKAQDELRGLLRPAQEATLITMGVLD